MRFFPSLESTRYTNSRICERRRRANLCSFNEPRRGFNPSDVSTLRQYLMHVLSVIKWQRVYRLRPRCRPPTQIIAFNSPRPPRSPSRQPSSPAGYHRLSANAATAFQDGLASHNVLFISSAPLSRRAFSPGIFIASRNPSFQKVQHPHSVAPTEHSTGFNYPRRLVDKPTADK